MEKDTYYVWGYPLFARETCICNEGNPLFARESCICNEGNPLFARESKGSPPTRFKNNIVYYSQAHFFNSFYTYRFKLKAIYLSIHLSIMNLHKEVLALRKKARAIFLFLFDYLVFVNTVIGSLSNYDDDVRRQLPKTIGLMIKTTVLHVHHAF